MLKFLRRRKEKQILEDKINLIIKDSNYYIAVFIIDYKCFGNILLKLVAPGKMSLKFITDRGEIILNNMPLNDLSYNVAGINDTIEKLLVILEKEFKQIKDYGKYTLNDSNSTMLVKVKFDSSKRLLMPNLIKQQDGTAYRPHFVVDGDNEYLGIEFIRSRLTSFNEEGFAVVRLLYLPNVNYSTLEEQVSFKIYEGGNQVGSGKVITRDYKY